MSIEKKHIEHIEKLLRKGLKIRAIRYLEKERVYDLAKAVKVVEEIDNELDADETLRYLNEQLIKQNKELAKKEQELQKKNKELQRSAKKLIESQHEIAQSQELITSINTNLTEGIYRSHAVGGLVYVNQSFVKMFGYKNPEEMLKIPSHELYADPKSRKGLTEEIIKDKSRLNIEVLYKRKDGSTFWGLNNYFLTLDENGDAVFDGALRDITEEKKNQKKTIESQRLLESINTNLSEGIYRSYSKGGLIYVNKAFAKMFGYDSPEEVLQIKSINLYANPTSREEPVKTLNEDKFRSNEETLFKRKDGSTFWGLNTYLITTNEEGVKVYDGAVRDITEQKAYKEELNKLNEELLQRNQALALQEMELEASNEELISNSENLVQTLEELSDRNFELDQLVYRTSHDLRSPLRSVLGLVNLFKIEVKNEPHIYIDKIEDSILKMDVFIKSMLDYSRASRMDIKNGVIDIRNVIKEIITGLEFLEGYKTMKITTKVTGDEKTLILDQLRLRIVIGNILSNAIKYRNTKLEINTLDITVNILKKKVSLVFEDNGIGISKKYLNKVFDMFYRATEQSDGSGLGMYIVKQSIDKLGGTINISSKLGVGSKIEIDLPFSS
jgi:PAS domain S-box-containing protein